MRGARSARVRESGLVHNNPPLKNTAAKGHITHPVRKHSTPNFIDANKVRHIKSVADWTKKGAGSRHPAGETGHTRAFIDRVLGVEKYPKRTKAQQVLTRAQARAKGAFK